MFFDISRPQENMDSPLFIFSVVIAWGIKILHFSVLVLLKVEYLPIYFSLNDNTTSRVKKTGSIFKRIRAAQPDLK